MNKFREIITSRVFLVNLGLLVIIILVLFIGLNIFLRSITHHGESLTVPDFKGLSLTEVKKLCDEKDLKFKIKDSTFLQGAPIFSVVDQSPKALSKVKKYRTIYLTINTNNPPKVELPSVIDDQLSRAITRLEGSGLKAGELSYVPGIGKNVVVKMMKDGKEIEANTFVPKGSAIDLVMNDGYENSQVEIQDLRGLTLEEASFTLSANGLSLGVVIYDKDVTDTTKAIIYKQNPKPDSKTMASQGEGIDLWLMTPEKYKQKHAKKKREE